MYSSLLTSVYEFIKLVNVLQPVWFMCTLLKCAHPGLNMPSSFSSVCSWPKFHLFKELFLGHSHGSCLFCVSIPFFVYFPVTFNTVQNPHAFSCLFITCLGCLPQRNVSSKKEVSYLLSSSLHPQNLIQRVGT